jgi:hypothetical protein
MPEMGRKGGTKGGKKGAKMRAEALTPGAAESDCPKSRKESMGQSKEKQKVLKFGDSRKPVARISFNFSMAPFPRLGYVGAEDRQTDGLSVCRLIPSQF